jgi:hypothetical protein
MLLDVRVAKSFTLRGAGRVELLLDVLNLLDDAAEEVLATPPGHTAWCHEDSEFIEFSPQHEFAILLDHVRKQVQGSR